MTSTGLAFFQIILILTYVVLSVLYFLRIQRNKKKNQRSMEDGSNP